MPLYQLIEKGGLAEMIFSLFTTDVPQINAWLKN
jgi:hypothetical protein